MSPAETTVVMVIVVGVVAMLVKWFTRDEHATAAAIDPVDALLAEVSGADPETAGEIVAITSDGWAFVPDGHAVQLIPPDSGEEELHVRSEFAGGRSSHGPAEIQLMGGSPVHPRTQRSAGSYKPGERINVGDLIGARVKRGAPDHDPWRLEAVGRDNDYRAWFFETEEAARAALALLDRRVVRPARDEDGEPRILAPADFDAARELDEETERALDAGEE